MQFDVLNRWSGQVQFTAEIDCADDAPTSIKLGCAVRWAFGTRAPLAGAYLVGADLADTYLANSCLSGVNLTGANLARVTLTDASLSGATLTGANLFEADLTGANLVRACLIGACLASATLIGANLEHANLDGANLNGATWTDGVSLARGVLQVVGLRYRVVILDAHAQIGCCLMRLSEWEALTEAQIGALDGQNAIKFWRTWREPLLAMARTAGCSFEPAPDDEKAMRAADPIHSP